MIRSRGHGPSRRQARPGHEGIVRVNGKQVTRALSESAASTIRSRGTRHVRPQARGRQVVRAGRQRRGEGGGGGGRRFKPGLGKGSVAVRLRGGGQVVRAGLWGHLPPHGAIRLTWRGQVVWAGLWGREPGRRQGHPRRAPGVSVSMHGLRLTQERVCDTAIRDGLQARPSADKGLRILRSESMRS